VSDLVDGSVKLMNANFTYPVNIGNPDEYTITEFAKMIKGLVSNLQTLSVHDEGDSRNVLCTLHQICLSNL
jgi:UDP-glucuronate decarboxylase